MERLKVKSPQVTYRYLKNLRKYIYTVFVLQNFPPLAVTALQHLHRICFPPNRRCRIQSAAFTVSVTDDE